VKSWVAAAVSFTVLVGAIVGATDYFAKNDDLTFVAQRLEQKIQSDQLHQTQERLWRLEDRNKSRNCDTWVDEEDRDECRKLKLIMEILRRELG